LLLLIIHFPHTHPHFELLPIAICFVIIGPIRVITNTFRRVVMSFQNIPSGTPSHCLLGMKLIHTLALAALVLLLLIVKRHHPPIQLSSPEQTVPQTLGMVSCRQGATARHSLLEDACSEPRMDHGHGTAHTWFVSQIQIQSTAEVAFRLGREGLQRE
jgi:hypothetical protein